MKKDRNELLASYRDAQASYWITHGGLPSESYCVCCDARVLAHPTRVVWQGGMKKLHPKKAVCSTCRPVLIRCGLTPKQLDELK